MKRMHISLTVSWALAAGRMPFMSLWQNLRTRFIEPTSVSAGAIGEDQGDYANKERD